MNIKSIDKGGVFALGNFDGVHRGHQLVLDAAAAEAQKRSLSANVLTFEPHPRAFFKPGGPPFRLTTAEEKERLLRAAGISQIVTLPFTAELAQLPAKEFVEEILIKELHAQHIVAGHDFVFGHGRDGNMQKLSLWLAPLQVGVTEIAPLGDQANAGKAFSSTRIRELIRQGKMEDAKAMLGRDFSISGKVIEGAKRGRTIGVPTANIALNDYVRPKYGVYTIRAGKDGEAKSFKGVANLGLRPTVDGKSEYLEAHLFDFSSDIYGEEWEIALTHFMRPEQKFSSIDALKAQIARDIKEAQSY